jgi:hypothetical protein
VEWLKKKGTATKKPAQQTAGYFTSFGCTFYVGDQPVVDHPDWVQRMTTLQGLPVWSDPTQAADPMDSLPAYLTGNYGYET